MRSKVSITHLVLLSLLTLASAVCLAQKPELVVQTGHSDSVLSVVFSPDGKTLASGSFDSTIKLWDLATGRELRTLRSSSEVFAIAFNADGKILASCGATIQLWEVATGRELRTLAGHSGWVNSVAFSADGQTLASGSVDTTIRLWEVDTGRELRTLNLTSHSPIAVVALGAFRYLSTGRNFSQTRATTS